MDANIISILLIIIAASYIFFSFIQIKRKVRKLKNDSAKKKQKNDISFGTTIEKIFQAKRAFNVLPFNFDWFLKPETEELSAAIDERQKKLVEDVLNSLQEKNDVSLEDVLIIAHKLKTQYPRLYFGYYISALVNQQLKKINEAEYELEEGLKNCTQKFPLYAAMGGLAYESGEADYAVAWWIKSAVTQINTKKIELAQPFIFLGYVCRYYNLAKIGESLFFLAKKTGYKPGLLSEQNEEKLFANLRKSGSEAIHRALLVLYTEHVSKMIY